MTKKKTHHPFVEREDYYAQKPSFIVGLFLDWLADMKDAQEEAWQIVLTEDDRVQDFLHEFEFEPDNKKRAIIATRQHQSRVKRRVAKDKATLLKPLREFAIDPTNKGFMKRLKKLHADLKAQEEYLEGERTYTPRVKEGGADGKTGDLRCMGIR